MKNVDLLPEIFFFYCTPLIGRGAKCTLFLVTDTKSNTAKELSSGCFRQFTIVPGYWMRLSNYSTLFTCQDEIIVEFFYSP